MGSIVTHGAAYAVEDSRCLLCSPIRRDIFTRYHLGTGEGATETVPRGSDGWRLFAPELRREQVLGVPAAPSLVLGSIALLAAIGDLRWIRAGGAKALRGVPRISRHLWRMCLALIVASLSIGQVKAVIAKLIRRPLVMGLPLVVLAALLYWLWRVRLRRSFRGVVVHGSPETPTMVEPVTLER